MTTMKELGHLVLFLNEKSSEKYNNISWNL